MGNGVGFFVQARDFVRSAYEDAEEQGISIIAVLTKQSKERVESVSTGSIVTKAVANGTELQKGTNTAKGIQHEDLSTTSAVLLTFAENAPVEVDTNLKMRTYLIRMLMKEELKYRSAKFFDFNQFFYRLKVR